MLDDSGLMVTGRSPVPSVLHASFRSRGLDGPVRCQLKSMLKLPVFVMKICRVDRSFSSTCVLNLVNGIGNNMFIAPNS